MKSGTISILGCGWLGLPLAKNFIAGGFLVKGSVTSSEKLDLLHNSGVLSYQVMLAENSIAVSDSGFFDCDVLIIAIPPRRVNDIERIFPAQIEHLIPEISRSGIEKVIFISSTSVYPENLQTAQEDDKLPPEKSSGKAIVLAENLLLRQKAFRTTVLRFGGLIGADRNPARFLLKAEHAIANAPVNLIHLDDCIAIIHAIVEKECWGEIFNACCPEHPFKLDFYGKAAEISGLPVPKISHNPETYKIVDSSKLLRILGYQFKYPSPMDYLDHLSGI